MEGESLRVHVELAGMAGPEALRLAASFRQIYWGSGVDLPEENYEARVDEFVTEALEVPAGEKAIISLTLAAGFVIVFEPVTHAAQFLDVKGECKRRSNNPSLKWPDNLVAPE